MNWLRTSLQTSRSPCGQYETRGSWSDGSYKHRGRHIDSDTLIQASADLEYVQRCCERHAAKAMQEARDADQT